jgi:hypothetical protein
MNNKEKTTATIHWKTLHTDDNIYIESNDREFCFVMNVGMFENLIRDYIKTNGVEGVQIIE